MFEVGKVQKLEKLQGVDVLRRTQKTDNRVDKFFAMTSDEHGPRS
jgi:hypothetical protein